MKSIEEVEEKILGYLNDVPTEKRFEYNVVISKAARNKMTDNYFKELNYISLTETKHTIFVSPYIEEDLVVLNNNVRPIRDMLKIDLD